MSALVPRSPSAVVDVVRTVVTEVREREVPFMAAAISYYTFVSLVPLLVLVVVSAVFLGGEALRAQIMASVRRQLPAAEQYVATSLDNRGGQGGLGAVSLFVTLWGALKIFRGTDTAFSRIYGSEIGGLLDQLRDAVAALLSIGAGAIGVLGLTVVMAAVEFPSVDVAGPLMLLVALSVAFLPFYYVFPDVDVSISEVLPGTLFAATGFTLLGAAFGFYAALTTSGTGALGAILLLVTYFYFAGMLLLTGAVLNAVLAGRLSNRQLQHDGTGGE